MKSKKAQTTTNESFARMLIWAFVLGIILVGAGLFLSRLFSGT